MLVQSVEDIEKQFYDSVFLISHSEKTVKTYRSGINHFKKFLSINFDCNALEIVDKIKSGNVDAYTLIRDFIIYLDQKSIKPRGLRSYLSGVKGYLRHLGVKLSSDDFKQLVKIPKVRKTRENPITKEMLVRILHNSSTKLQTAILVCCSSGLRIGELVQLKLSDIDFNSYPAKISVRGEIAKGSMSRETYISTEAVSALKDYLTKYFDWNENESNLHLQDTLIFWRISDVKDSSVNPQFDVESAKQILQSALIREIKKIPELNIKNENGIRTIHFHGFRKFFRTTVGNVCGRDYAEALMGHGFYMDTYYQLPEQKKQEMYLEAEPYLTISDFKEVEKNLKTLSAKYSELEAKFNEFKQYAFVNSIKVPEHLK